ncbi:hypothetical protein D918_01334 [Trichuris suis]|nr:hypothetical protein D918_01334 [Trichuris suis]
MDRSSAYLHSRLDFQALRDAILSLDIEITRYIDCISNFQGEMDHFNTLTLKCRKQMRQMELSVSRLFSLVQQSCDSNFRQQCENSSSIFELKVAANRQRFRRVLKNCMERYRANERSKLLQCNEEPLAWPASNGYVYPVEESNGESLAIQNVKNALETLKGIVWRDSVIKNRDMSSRLYVEEVARQLQHLQNRLENSIRLIRKYRQRNLTTAFLILYSVIVFTVVVLAILFQS